MAIHTAIPTPLGMTADAFSLAWKSSGFPGGSVAGLAAYRAFYRDGSLAGLPGPIRIATERLIAPIVRQQSEPCDEGMTVKFCQRLDRDRPDTGPGVRSSRAVDSLSLGVLNNDARVEHLDIESVVIPMLGRTGRRSHTLCVSSQVGCAMGCEFCETAQMGLIRSLSAAEIACQWWAATHLLNTEESEPVNINNIVFMGMGEPLDNFDEVIASIACLTDNRGANISMSCVTISTVGRVDGLRRLAKVVQQTGWKRLGLALSVNAPNDTVRDALMPVNRKWNMEQLQRIMLELVELRSTRKILFEYVLIPGVNDSDEHAEELFQWLRPFTRHEQRTNAGLLNIIPYNPRRNSPWPAPDEASVGRFVDLLADKGIFVKRRRTKGRDQMAACGQLGSAQIRKRKYVEDEIASNAGTPHPAV